MFSIHLFRNFYFFVHTIYIILYYDHIQGSFIGQTNSYLSLYKLRLALK